MSNSCFPPIAIVGLSGVFPKATGTADFWQNIKRKIDAAIEVPEKRWVGPLKWVYNSIPQPDMAYSRRACLVQGFQFDPSGFFLDRQLLEALDPLHQWVLHVSRDALRNCGIIPDKSRTGVVLAAIALPTDISSKISRMFLERRIQGGFPVKAKNQIISLADSLCGRVVGSPAAVVSHGLGLGGVSYTLDAACASSLYALKLACDELQAHRADAMLAGGVSRPDCLYTQIGFSQLRALSPSGRCAPFDKRADGLVVGEGAGILVLKRLEDAIEHGDIIYGVIRGIGLTNDMRGNLLAPESAGQVRAMQRAYDRAGWHPHDVDYIECHGAGTTVGDTTELSSLRALWGNEGWQLGQCAIGSIKSMIGHLLTGAGAAGMIKTLLALHHKTLPPSLNFKQPPASSPLIDSPFRVQVDAAPWPRRTGGTPRRAAVSAFGFGGINAHVLVEEWLDDSKSRGTPGTIEIREKESCTQNQKNDIAIVGMDLHLGTIESVRSFQEAVFNGRSVLAAPLPERRKALEIADSLPAAYIEKISIGLGEFQIPPGEIPDILPQQLLMLKKAAGAMIDAGLPLKQMRERVGAIIGIGFDYEATNFHRRWALPSLIAANMETSGMRARVVDWDRWLAASKDDCGPPLTATRTLGALGGIVASRIAREFRFGGPSFVVSAEEASGLRALEIAVQMLQSGDVDAMLVGAVDLNCDPRNMATLYSRLSLSAKGQIRPFDLDADGALPGEGAVALVLKRVEDAVKDNDRIYAVVQGIGGAPGCHDAGFKPKESSYIGSLARALEDAGAAPAQIGLMETHGSGIPDQDLVETRALHTYFGEQSPPDHGHPIAIGTLKPIVGHTGAVSGLASLAKAALCLFHQITPPCTNFEKPAQPQWRQGLFHMPSKAAFWAHNRLDGPLKACVAAMTSDGGCMHAVLGQDSAISQPSQHARSPLGPLPYGLFVIDSGSPDQLLDEMNDLEKRLPASTESPGGAMESLARNWYQRSRSRSDGDHILSIVADSVERLEACLDVARQAVATGGSSTLEGRGGVCYLPDGCAAGNFIAFVYPGSGNHYVGMGRALGLRWPAVLRDMNLATDRFKAQMLPQWYDPFRVDWSAGWQQESYANLVADPLRTIFGQVLFGGQVTGLLQRCGLRPDAVIGYSLGESAGLFAMGAWPDRGAMLERLESSDLFKTQLSGTCEALRQAWKIPDGHPVTWRVAAVNRSREAVDAVIANQPWVRRLIVNTPDQCVIGGLQEPLQAAIAAMQCEAIYLDGVVTVHCDAAQPAAQAYKDLHRFPTTPVKDVRFYSCALGRAHDLTEESAAESITRQALDGFDFPRTIRQAYEDGVRVFVEIGPHCSCTRMINRILGDKPHLAVAANQRGEDEPLTLLKCLGTLIAAGVAVDLDWLYGDRPGSAEISPRRVSESREPHEPTVESSPIGQKDNTRIIDVPVGGKLSVLHLPIPDGAGEEHPARDASQHRLQSAEPLPSAETTTGSTFYGAPPWQPAADFDGMISRFNENVGATAKAHEQFLELSQQLTAQYGDAFDFQNQLLAALKGRSFVSLPSDSAPPGTDACLGDSTPEPLAFDRSQCMEFAVGSVGNMLGPDFDIVDTFKARVRLPDEPLMLVDRILRVEGQKLSLGSGRVVTEHDVLPAAWYLDGDRAPVCISVEAGQADLFLCAYLGIDHKVRGERTYRLLDAKIRFHRGLPRPGETIRYDIHIDKFVRQEETYLFFFRFEGHIGDTHFISMSQGCAGFFTEAEVRNSGGILLTDEDKKPGATVGGTPFDPLVPLSDETYDDNRLQALRRGDAGFCFGPVFDGIQLPGALRLPSGRMRLIHRIVALQPQGGRFGKGYICAEADIHPDDWFLTCHFVDDMVMPGTLMYECCAHTLRVLLMRLGWVTDKADVAYEPIQGLDCRLKCRGPVTPRTRKVHYAVEVKEIGYTPEPYVIADAHMYADDRYIVFFKDMSMQMTGVRREDIIEFWKQRNGEEKPAGNSPGSVQTGPLFNHEHILAFAVGNPSEAFGQPYAIFDHLRTIARLPGPPYCFMDRIISIEPEPWVLQPGGWVEAQYDVPADAWYFSADRSGIMPFCVLLEIALQPCGWLAAFAGSALHSENDLKFRNLGGQAVVHGNLRPASRTLTMRTRMTKVSEAADMIIEHFEFQVLDQDRPIYDGTTYFGFFTAGALAQQVGLREPVYVPDPKELQDAGRQTFGDTPPRIPEEAGQDTDFTPRGLQMPAKSLCMIDGIEAYCPHGGPHGLGFVRGYKMVDPNEWFFKAHFYQDPVCPGSLGIESFLQLIKYAAMQRWPRLINSHNFEMVCGSKHQWSYRGQVVPANRKVTVDAVITRIEEGDQPMIMADGWLHVDGITIYKMVGFGFRLSPE
jgi:acyl transferase domain-containing protein/3-hydroxymyristoyl/3-hydroxydecanoyl-(acyl carrier protein) dehydratase